MKKFTAQALLARKTITIADLLSKADNEDWHGVADAAMDLREIDAQLEVLEVQNILGSGYVTTNE